jgi:hypothetical protein
MRMTQESDGVRFLSPELHGRAALLTGNFPGRAVIDHPDAAAFWALGRYVNVCRAIIAGQESQPMTLVSVSRCAMS